MNLIRKLLDLLNMDNWNRNRDNDNTITQIKLRGKENSSNTNNINSQISSMSIDQIFDQIKFFWQKNSINQNKKSYRKCTRREKQNYALIDILSCFRKHARSADNFSDMTLAELGITNWNHFFRSLLQNEYVRPANISETIDAKYTVSDLKIIADSLGCKKTGKKSDLIERIIPMLSQNQIDNIVSSSQLYILSEKGEQLLSENADYIPLHKYRYIVSLAEFNDNRLPDGIHKRNFYDTMFQILSDQCFWYQAHHNWNMLSITYLNIYHLLMEEDKKNDHVVRYDIALNNYVTYFYLATCLCQQMYFSVNYNVFPSVHAEHFLPEPQASAYKLASYESSIDYNLIFSTNPPSLLTNEEFKLFVHDLLTVQMFDKAYWDALLAKRVKDFTKFMKTHSAKTV